MDHEVNAAIGESVHRLMWRRGIPQRDLARRLGITQQAVSRKLHGDRPWTVVEVLEVAEWLEVPLEVLVPEVLPRVDSNHQPSGYGYHQVSGHLQLVAA